MTQTRDRRQGIEPGAIVAPLEDTLVDIIDLNIQAEQAHWTIAGRGSESLRVFLNQLIDQTRDWHDEVSLRLGVTGDSSEGYIPARAAAKPLELLPAGDLRDGELAAFLDRSIGQVAERTRACLKSFGASDPASRDLLARIVDGLDRQVRILRRKSTLGRRALDTVRVWPRGSRDSSAA